MSTDIYEMDSNGDIHLRCSYTLDKKAALRAAVYQELRNRWDTWNYSDEDVTIVQYHNEYIHLHRESVWFTRSDTD